MQQVPICYLQRAGINDSYKLKKNYKVHEIQSLSKPIGSSNQTFKQLQLLKFLLLLFLNILVLTLI